MTISRAPWSEADRNIIREFYPAGGAALCLGKLSSKRTHAAVIQAARAMKIRAPEVCRHMPHKWPSNEHIDAAIRSTYQNMPTRGDITALCTRVCRPRYWVQKRAAMLGAALPRYNTPWSNAEIVILDLNSHRPPRRIQRELRREGFSRSIAAIVHKRTQMQLLPHDGIYTGCQLAGLMGVKDTKIYTLIKRGMLQANRAGSARNPAQGDIYEITDNQIRDFIMQYPGEFDHRRVDKFWFIDLLTHPIKKRKSTFKRDEKDEQETEM